MFGNWNAETFFFLLYLCFPGKKIQACILVKKRNNLLWTDAQCTIQPGFSVQKGQHPPASTEEVSESASLHRSGRSAQLLHLPEIIPLDSEQPEIEKWGHYFTDGSRHMLRVKKQLSTMIPPPSWATLTFCRSESFADPSKRRENICCTRASVEFCCKDYRVKRENNNEGTVSKYITNLYDLHPFYKKKNTSPSAGCVLPAVWADPERLCF